VVTGSGREAGSAYFRKQCLVFARGFIQIVDLAHVLVQGISKPIMIFYLGDHDPSGHDIESNIHRRAQLASGKEFRMIRLAIHPEDIKAFRLSPQKVKDKDPRGKGVKRKFGNKAATVELDALPVEELRRHVREGIERLIDCERWNRQAAVQLPGRGASPPAPASDSPALKRMKIAVWAHLADGYKRVYALRAAWQQELVVAV
jgi:hypothetical protein